MQRIKVVFFIWLLAAAGLWFLADALPLAPFEWFAFRRQANQLTGVVLFSVMTLGMVLAVRPAVLEKSLNGLDKTYRLHKWLGVTALCVGLMHWWITSRSRWMANLGWITLPVRKPAKAPVDATTFAGWMDNQHHLAQTVGEWCFYALVVFIVVALLKVIPYRIFQKAHRFIALIYLGLAFHAFIMLRNTYWPQPVGVWMALMLALGVAAALWSLLRRTGKSRQHAAQVLGIDFDPVVKVSTCTLAVDARWPGHRAGQFAFVRFGRGEGPHPYTIASAWEKGQVTFLTKALGDFTRVLPNTVKVGDAAIIEGPYGCFDFRGESPQIWVGAGIGITPFLARMRDLARHAHQQDIILFYSVSSPSETFLALLREDAAAAGVDLRVVVSGQDPRLSATAIRLAAPNWRKSSLWFCGPAAFGESLRQDFRAAGLPARQFHQEVFQMR